MLFDVHRLTIETMIGVEVGISPGTIPIDTKKLGDLLNEFLKDYNIKVVSDINFTGQIYQRSMRFNEEVTN